jgi:Beta-lactamase class C and other penicillin binding proteins
MLNKILKNSLLTLLLCSILFKSACISFAAEQNENEGKTINTVRAIAEKQAKTLTEQYGVGSVQYALIDNGIITLSGEAGSGEHNMYGIASISKIFTTAAVMKLVEEGKINLDQPVTDYITDFKMADQRYKKITVRMLLNHSSGLMGYTLGNVYLFQDKDMTTYHNLLNILSTERLKSEPGEFSVYCNDGFSLAELLVERVSGVSFSKFVSDNITSKLDMKDTYTSADMFDTSKLCNIYTPGTKKAMPTEYVNMIGPGGFYSTADDLCKFATAFMKNSSGILSKQSLAAMENKEFKRGIWPEEKDSSLSYGLGWDSVDTFPFNQYNLKALFKGGDSMFFHSGLTVLPEQNMAVAVVSTGGSSDFNQVMAQQILLTALKEKGVISEIKKDKVIAKPCEKKMPSKMMKYTGFYANYASTFYVSIHKDGRLYIMTDPTKQNNSEEFSYGGNGKFYSITADSSSYVSFKKEINGEIYLNRTGYSTLKGLGQIANSMYEGQKLNTNLIPAKLASIWKKRVETSYFLISDKYSSELYSSPDISRLKFSMNNYLPGYFDNATIMDENNAKTLVKIPGVYGRDLRDYHFYKKNKVEYLKMGNVTYISENSIKNLPLSSKFIYTITQDGYGKIYKVGKKSENKFITVEMPNKATLIVYDKKGTCINNSYLTGKTSIQLPENGYILLVGEPKAEFVVHVK